MTRIIKTLLIALLLLCLTATLSACGGSSSSRKTCPSCGKTVTSLVTKKDAFGDTHTWCSSCWSDYHSIMGY